MLCKFCLVLVCLFAFATEVHNKPATRLVSGVQRCFNKACPENTYACEREAKLSEDKKEIVGVIRCLGLRDHILRNITTSEPNPFGPDAQYQHYSYSAAYEVTNDSGSIGNSVETTNKVENSDKKTGNDEVEVFNEAR